MNDAERQRLIRDLAASREALLAVAERVRGDHLPRPTRNPGWTMAHVLAHVLAADADLAHLLETASTEAGAEMPDSNAHERQTARWLSAAPDALVEELRRRGARWRDLLASLPVEGLGRPVRGMQEGATVGATAAEWRGHDDVHAEDVRLAISETGR